MDANEFVMKLKAIAPTRKSLEIKYNLKLTEGILGEWEITPLTSEEQYDDPVFYLITKYDCSKLYIGQIKFYTSLRAFLDTHIAFGNLVEDIFIVDLDTSEVQVIDRYNSMEVKFYCSKDTETFLDTLIIYSRFASDEIVGIVHTKSELAKMLDEIIQINPDDKYHPVWRMLLGIEPMY